MILGGIREAKCRQKRQTRIKKHNQHRKEIPMKRSQWTILCALALLLYEALADLSWTPFPLLDIHAGYKVIRVHLDRDDLYLNSEFAGPYVALTVSF